MIKYLSLLLLLSTPVVAMQRLLRPVGATLRRTICTTCDCHLGVSYAEVLTKLKKKTTNFSALVDDFDVPLASDLEAGAGHVSSLVSSVAYFARAQGGSCQKQGLQSLVPEKSTTTTASSCYNPDCAYC